jgi:hypothetical protein
MHTCKHVHARTRTHSVTISTHQTSFIGLNGSNKLEEAQIHMIWDSLAEMQTSGIKAFFCKDPEQQVYKDLNLYAFTLKKNKDINNRKTSLIDNSGMLLLHCY